MAANFLANGIQTVVYLGIAVVVSWKLALTALLMGGAIAFSLHSLVRMSRRAGHRQNERTRELVVYLSDALNSIKPLKAMAKQGSFALLFDRKIYSLKKALRRQIVSLEARKSFEEILITGCLGASFYVAVAVWSYQISDVLVMGILLVQTMRNVGKIQELFQKAVLLQSPYRSLIDLISEVTEAREKGGGARVPTLNEGCRFESVSFSFAQSPVLANATFDIPANRITVFTGPSGSGKTTIADLLLGLRYPEGGRILIDGMLLDEVDLEKWRGMIGYVPQELILFHDTVFTNVALGDPTLGEADVRHALEVAGAWEFVAAMPNGMMSHVGEKGAKLSGGQRQRIALARALVGKPKLMILDEVTSALDPEIERDICLRIQKFAKDMTVIAITHRSAFLEIADHLYRVEGGRVERLSAGDLAALVLAT
jgi:ATP-binding cassette subfamily C protein